MIGNRPPFNVPPGEDAVPPTVSDGGWHWQTAWPSFSVGCVTSADNPRERVCTCDILEGDLLCPVEGRRMFAQWQTADEGGGPRLGRDRVTTITAAAVVGIGV